jgi:hypothetical protein
MDNRAATSGQDVSLSSPTYWATGRHFRVAPLAAVAMAMPIPVYEVLAFIARG